MSLPEKRAMVEASTLLRRVLRSSAVAVLRCLSWLRADPVTVVTWAELLAGRVGFFETPTAATIIAKYLRGFVLFGKPNTSCLFWQRFPARAIIASDTAHVPKTLRSLQRRGELEVRYNQDLGVIIRGCQEGRQGWLTPALVNIYLEMQKLGLVATVGTYRDGQLVGGIFGLAIGHVFSITSMFHVENHAGALALAALVDIVAHEGGWSIIDCGTLNSNWERYGAREIPVQQFSELVVRNLKNNNVASSGADNATELGETCVRHRMNGARSISM